jgi:hypothetical protein
LAGLFQAATTLSIICWVGVSVTNRCSSSFAMNFGVEGCATMASSAIATSLMPFGSLEPVAGMIFW